VTRDPERVTAGYDACQVEARAAAANFWLGIRLLPRERRRALAAVYWFSDRADRAVDGDGTLDARRTRLAVVRHDLARALEGDGPDARWDAVADAVARYSIPEGLLTALLDGVERDLEPEPCPDWDATRAYCWGVAGVVGLVALRIYGGDPIAAPDAEEVGTALQLTNILRDVREDALAGRWYLPLDECARFGVDPAGVAAGDPGPGWPALVATQVERARASYAAGPRLLDRLPRESRASPAALMGVYRGLLERIARDPWAPLRERVRLATPVKLARGLSAAATALWR